MGCDVIDKCGFVPRCAWVWISKSLDIVLFTLVDVVL